MTKKCFAWSGDREFCELLPLQLDMRLRAHEIALVGQLGD